MTGVQTCALPIYRYVPGEYKVDKISDIVQLNVPVVDFFGNVSNTVHKSVLQLNNSIVNNNLNGTGRSIVSGDILVNKYNNRYKVMEYEDGKEYNYNEFPIMTLSETFLPSVGDTLHISSDILYERTLEYTINPTYIEFLYFKDLSPNIKIESALYTNVPLIINPKELKTKGLKGEEISIYDYQIKYLYDYQEWITETVKSAMVISRNAGIKPNPPVLLEENLKSTIAEAICKGVSEGEFLTTCNNIFNTYKEGTKKWQDKLIIFYTIF